MTKNEKTAARTDAMKLLRKVGVRPGAKVYTGVDHVSRSGMSRHISVYVVHKGEICDVTGWVGLVLGYRRSRDGGLVVGGCGMDMGFHVVYSLGRTMFPKGGPIGKSARQTDGGYLLKQAWI
jgi:hypothetical protein